MTKGVVMGETFGVFVKGQIWQYFLMMECPCCWCSIDVHLMPFEQMITNVIIDRILKKMENAKGVFLYTESQKINK